MLVNLIASQRGLYEQSERGHLTILRIATKDKLIFRQTSEASKRNGV